MIRSASVTPSRPALRAHATTGKIALVAALVFLGACASTGTDVPKPAPIEVAKPIGAPMGAPVAPPPTPTPEPVAKPAPLPAPQPQAEKPAAPTPRKFAALKPGSHGERLSLDKTERSYVLHVPKGYDPAKPVPLVIVLHARGSSAKGATVYGFDQKSDRDGFAVVYPEALGQPRVWNAVHDRGTSGANDTAFVLAVLDAVMAEMNVDARRVYVVGSSSGAMMAYRVAAEHPQRFAAAAVFAGAIGTRNPKGVVLQVPKPATPVSLLHVHGRSDRTIPYGGGKSITLPGAAYVGASDSAHFWADADGCEPRPATTTAGPVTREIWSKCRGDARVELLSIESLSHTWPHSVRLDPKRPAQSLADVIWDFFRPRLRS